MVVALYRLMHTQCGPNVLGLIFFKNRRHVRKTYLFLIHNKLHFYKRVYKLLRDRTISEKLPKIPLFESSLIRQLRLLGSQKHPQNGARLTSFSTWGAENSLAGINLESTGVIKGCNIFLGQKLANTCSLVAGRIIVQQENVSTAEHSWTNTLNALHKATH